MGRLASTYRQAVAAHHAARAHLDVVRDALRAVPVPAPAPGVGELVSRLGEVGAAVTAPDSGTAPLADTAVAIRLGAAFTPEGAFPALVPLGGGRHLAIDTDARDPRVARLLRSLVVRLLAAAPPGEVHVVGIDTSAPNMFGPLRPLVDAGVLAPPACTDAEVGALLDTAERHARTARLAPGGGLLLVVAAGPAAREPDRLAALTQADARAALCVLAAGRQRRPDGEPAPSLGSATLVRLTERYAYVGDPPGTPFSADGGGLAAPVLLDGDPPVATVRALAGRLGEAARRADERRFAELLPERRWVESSGAGLQTVVGRSGPAPVTVTFDDTTPHWLVGGGELATTDSFLTGLLHGLAARHAPTELQLYLLGFPGGVSFAEFGPTGRDPSWLPHVRALGVESDREYAVTVLRELRREVRRRATVLKRQGVTRFADLPRDPPLPRIVAVIDEFPVLLAGGDEPARESASLLGELLRGGGGCGVHLVLAGRDAAGVAALRGDSAAPAGRVALGGAGVLDPANEAAEGLPHGVAVVNVGAGAAGADTVVRLPGADATAATVTRLRHELWRARPSGSSPPAVFRGYENTRIEQDATYAGLRPGGRRPLALVGRTVDVHVSSAMFIMDTTPGRHLGVVGSAPAGADVLRAATLSLARQHLPGQCRFLLAPLVAGADPVADETTAALTAGGHPVEQLDADGLRARLATLADPTPPDPPPAGRTFLVAFGMDGAATVLGAATARTSRHGRDDLRAVLRHGPGRGVHLLGWWRDARRLADDVGDARDGDGVACLVALDVSGGELRRHLGLRDVTYTPRPDRALLVDRHDRRVRLIVPFARPAHDLAGGG
ncbi:cell division protein FtsK [Micromonospora sp. 15K316]|uniref:FtsK/SpoIIIE domain-containing protein n=1 Tax=Micromonospora sp. 15K316 TaxID=2530376 RepID=UPI0010513867|nr:FtsK/SpoIIIE domain-containing protein [Micromonospora sp. 15K316]TDC25336.1 cell division protein FtsK [Micromonospora sp. 15K316]